ncbi:hypothetical protein C8R46DRAFT_1073847 [Mycena filopes]|nr:hypothetical protein C8R46DRAFT_1073847 [Mycena filopes]
MAVAQYSLELLGLVSSVFQCPTFSCVPYIQSNAVTSLSRVASKWLASWIDGRKQQSRSRLEIERCTRETVREGGQA